MFRASILICALGPAVRRRSLNGTGEACFVTYVLLTSFTQFTYFTHGSHKLRPKAIYSEQLFPFPVAEMSMTMISYGHYYMMRSLEQLTHQVTRLTSSKKGLEYTQSVKALRQIPLKL